MKSRNKNRQQIKDKEILNFITESGILKRISRSGWWVLGIKHPESVAEHSFRCAVIAYILAKMEKVPYSKPVLMALLNDIHETRINDLHKMAQRYIDSDVSEKKAFLEQVKTLPQAIKSELILLRKQYLTQKDKESIIARDADILECLIQAKEYKEYGFKEAGKFMKKAPGFLKTKSASRLWRLAKNMELNQWWESLSSFKR